MYAKPKTNFGIEDMQRQQAFVEQYMRSVDVPDWYRGMSSFQLRAANKLQNAIRDDLQQATSHRVRSVLNTIGLRPPISKTKIHFVMRLSRGNDLAFLWFIKDLYYKSEGPDYSLNEQLILSCIAHLDLIFTIRGLDGILPPQQTPRRKSKQYEAPKLIGVSKPKLRNPSSHRIQHESKPKKIITLRKLYKLPYLEKLRLPQPYGKSLTSHPPDHVLHLKFLDVYKDPNYIVPNESSRWFANYNISFGRQTANSLVNENLDLIFKEEVFKIHSQIFDAQIFRDLRFSRRSSGLKVNSEWRRGKIVQCKHHEVIDELERGLEHELRVIARDKCEKYFDAETAKKEKRILRLRKQIENDVNIHLGRFKELANKSRSQLLLLSKENVRAYSMPDFLNDNKENRLCGGEERKSDEKSECSYIFNECGMKSKPRNPSWAQSENNIRLTGGKNAIESEIVGDCLDNNKTRKSSKEHILHSTSLRKQCRLCRHCDCKSQSDLSGSTYDHVQNYDYGHSEGTTDSCKPYFNAPNKHRPYKFDYQKIFDVALDGDQAADRVKRACVGAIKSDEIIGIINSKSKENVDAAIKNYVLKTFKSKLKDINEGNAEAEGVAELPSVQRNIKYYDPDDKELMHRLLKEALERLTKDTRYVLPTLPDAHKMPILRYWIYQRFGKVYTRTELSQIFKKSTQLFRAINKMTINEKLPTPKNLGRAVYINYGCRDYLLRKGEYIRDLFYKRMDDSIMEQSRRLYMAMSPYLCTRLAKTIFAYLPARPSDIHHFHVWNPQNYKVKSKSSIGSYAVGSMY